MNGEVERREKEGPLSPSLSFSLPRLLIIEKGIVCHKGWKEEGGKLSLEHGNRGETEEERGRRKREKEEEEEEKEVTDEEQKSWGKSVK